MRYRFAAFLLPLIATLAPALDSVSGSYAIEPPKGWIVNPPGGFGLKESIFLAPDVVQDFRSNLVFVEESMGKGDNLEAAVKGSVRVMSQGFVKFRVLSQSKLRTASGLEVAKVVYERELTPDRPLMLNACYFVIVRNNRLLTVTACGTAATPKATFEAAEASVLTLRSL